MLMLPVLLWGCSGVLSNVLPAGAVLSPTEADAFEAPALPSVRYTGDPPRLPGPLPPLQVFGVYYAVDIVIVSDHPDWNMHEYARLDAPQGSVWLAKDSTHDGVQTITADLPDIETWVADVPVPRRAGPIAVQEDWDGDHLTLSLDYTNPHDQAVSVQVEARVPSRPPRLRNGNTMGHSRQAVAAVLDLERMGDAKAEISIDGEARKVVRLLGLAPMEFVLQQAQAGFAIADFAAQPTDGGLRITRPGQDAAWPSRAEEVWERQDGPDGLTRLVYDAVGRGRPARARRAGAAGVALSGAARRDPSLCGRGREPVPPRCQRAGGPRHRDRAGALVRGPAGRHPGIGAALAALAGRSAHGGARTLPARRRRGGADAPRRAMRRAARQSALAQFRPL